MHRFRPLILAAIVAAAVLLLGGCGGSDNSGYVDSVNHVTSQLQNDVSQISSGAGVNSPQQAADVFTQVSDKVDAAAADLEGITPPDQVADLHQKLVGEMK